MADTGTKFQFATIDNLSLFKDLIDADHLEQIEKAISPAIKTVSQSADGLTVYFYTQEAPVTEDQAAFSIILPSPVDITGKADKVAGATEGNFAGLDSTGNLTDSGYSYESFDLSGASDEVRQELTELIGSIPVDAVATNIVAYIQEAVESGAYDDTELRDAVQANTTALDILNGTGTGSVKQAIVDALTEFVEGAPETLDQYKELTDWILNHETDAMTMSNSINQNTSDIADLKALIGEIPETATSTTVIDYVAEYVSNVVFSGDVDKYALAEDLDAAVERIGTLESTVGTLETTVATNSDKISDLESLVGTLPTTTTATTIVAYIEECITAITTDLNSLTTRVNTAEDEIDGLQSDLSTAQTDISNNTTAIQVLQDMIGDGYEAIPEADIRALFGDDETTTE